jgi:DNA-binding LytR/AlgR family response regulator
MIIRCAIIDDEPLASGLLKSYVTKTPYLALKGIYNSALQAMKELRDDPVNLIFLDIQMPELSGVEFAKVLSKKTRVIFTTAFPQYALEGFKVNALDYLLKPISYEDFLSATDKALEWFSKMQKHDIYTRDRVIYVKSDYKLLRISLDDILYVEGLRDYARFFLRNGENIQTIISMKKLDDFLPRPEFLRTHRSYIVHMPSIQAVEHNRIVFGEVYIPVSDYYKDDVQTYLDDHTLG